MASFILRNLDPDFWARVQAKATAEGTTVKAVILKLLLQWLGVVVIVTASSACSPHLTSPTPVTVDLTTPTTLTLDATPSAARTARITATVHNSTGGPLGAIAITFSTDAGTLPADAITDATGSAQVTLIGPAGPAKVTARAGTLTTSALVALQAGSGLPNPTDGPEPTPLPVPPPSTSPAPLTVSIVGQSGVAGTPTLFGLSVSAQVTRADWTFGDGAIATTAGAQTSHVYAAGPYTASVVVTDDLGRTASASTSLVIVPPPSAPPVPTPTLAAVITCSPPAMHDPLAATPCNVSVTYGSLPVASGSVTRVDWDFGDGFTIPNGGVVNTRTYVNAGTYPVQTAITATTIDGVRTTTATKAVVIP